jgi:hypothetical protein
MQIGPKYVFCICILLKRIALETHSTPLVSKIMEVFHETQLFEFSIEWNEKERGNQNLKQLRGVEES